MNRTKKSLRASFSAVAAITLAFVVAVSGLVSAGNNTDALDRAAAQAKARQIVESAATLVEDNVLFAREMYDKAKNLAPHDTVVMLAVNNMDIMLNPEQNPLYFTQLDMLEKYADAPIRYYYTLLRVTPPDSEANDSLDIYRTSVKALKRFPKNQMFIDEFLDNGLSYLYRKRYVNTASNQKDTLDLNPATMAFAEQLLAEADTIEKNNGFNLSVDKARAAIYELLERKDDLRTLASALEKRDSTDVDILDLMTAIAYVNNDSTKLSELGLRRFSLVPAPDHIYSLYNAMPNDSMRTRLADAVFETSLNTDLEPALRIDLLTSLAHAYYKNTDDGLKETQSAIPSRISEILTEISSEDPTDEKPYLRSVILVEKDDWVYKYGYKHWIEAVDNIPDTTGAQQVFAEVLVSNMPKDGEFEKRLVKLTEQYRAERPDLVLPSILTTAQYYYNNDMSEKAIALIGNLTLENIREASKLHNEFILSRSKDEQTSGKENLYTEEDDMKRWVAIQSLLAECYMKVNKVDDALYILNHLIALNPENSEALNNLAYYMCINGRDLTVALSFAERSLAIDPENLNTIDTRAWILYNKGDIEGAYADMERLFLKLDIILKSDILEAESTDKIIEVLTEKTNLSAIGPLLGHIAVIMSKTPDFPAEHLEYIIEALKTIDPENEDLPGLTKK